MTQSLNGKVILITGAASGIGRATAIKLAKLGASLALTDINEAGLQETAALADPAPCITAGLDVSDHKRCDLVINETLQYFGHLDHVFNCAGINPTAYQLTKAPQDYFDRLMSVNVKGTYNVTRAAIPHLKEHNGCSIVNVSSILGLRPAKEMAIYCATKYAIVGFTKAMALELGRQGIRVNAVAPGYVDTPTNSDVVQGEASMKASAEQVSLGRMGKPDEIANVVAFLMSDEARFMNGSVVQVDGGMSI